MISNICKIQNGTEDLNEILYESEKVALYMGLEPTIKAYLSKVKIFWLSLRDIAKQSKRN